MRTLDLCKKLPIWLLGATLCAASFTSMAADVNPYELDGDTEDSTANNPGDGTTGGLSDYGDALNAPMFGDDADTVFLQECREGRVVLPVNNDPGSIYSNANNCGAAWAAGMFQAFDPNSDSDTAAFEQVFIDDSFEPDASHHQPSNKDEAPLGGAAGGGLSAVSSDPWGCVIKPNVNNKNDLLHGVVTFYRDAEGAIYSYAGADRDKNEGNENFGVWYLQDPEVGCTPTALGGSGEFTGVHMHGDILAVGEFTKGGSLATILIFEWQDPSPASPESGDEVLALINTGGNCSVAHPATDACGEVNGASIFPAWRPIINGATATGSSKKPKFGELQDNMWAEMGDQIIPAGSDICFSKVMLESRTSQSVTANLFDFMLANVNICGSITIEKVTIGDTGTFDIDTDIPDGTNAAGTEPSAGDFDLTTTASGVAGLDSETFLNLQAGDYDVSELVPAGWELTAMTCTGDDDGGSVFPLPAALPISTGGTGTFMIDLDIGESITCRFVNEALGDISATKVVVNACDVSDGGLFTLRLDGVAKATNIGDGGGFGPLEVSPGSFTVDEIAGTGTDLANYTSTTGGDCATDGSVTVGTGDSKSCTITNVRRPTIKIVKELTGGSGPTFDLLIDDGNNNSFDHETEAQGDGGMTSSLVVTTVLGGSGLATTYGPVKVAETAADGAETIPGAVTIPASVGGFTSSWRCDDTGTTTGSGASVVVPALLPGEDVTCIVTNIPVAAAACTPGS
ncbi:prealbumin-like fold domain-containing protein [Marinobacterium rhizophilum]|uniref:SpaA-like prealbumin fold domain-containing protein n=1 Tax=Marinobacterium rhizophilum TaxID=420402 RepID=A0ABY5HK03_9GAMM|nr:hypothetical protein [Marinobacterium rhizophilum]UTW12191.1 hypothetical protein KDW95_00410 [Marinobacterium rhizophilum]